MISIYVGEHELKTNHSDEPKMIVDHFEWVSMGWIEDNQTYQLIRSRRVGNKSVSA